jgi:putative ABC transport system substrate-binding protein
MAAVLKKIALGLAMIVVSAAILLYSDLDSRRVSAGRGARGPLKVAVVQQTSIPALDEGLAGALAAMKERGYVDGGPMILRQYNAQGDTGTGNAIAKEVTSGDFDLIFTLSTVSLQTVANANRFATPPRHHVFALVSDPYGVGVGVSRENHSIHPSYMTGVGSLAPVEDLFRLAKQMLPTLNRVGLVWDPSEANSVITTKLGRSVCASLGITLVEANAENSTEVGDATASLLARNVQAIWISPDLITSHGLDLIVSKAKAARIPVITSVPRSTPNGTLFELGADYIAIGRVAGNLAADVLDGRDPASIPVENVMPVSLQVNRTVLASLRERWELPDAIIQRANVVVDESGRHVKDRPLTSTNGGANSAPARPAGGK